MSNIKGRLEQWRSRMPDVWYGNKDLDDAINEIDRLTTMCAAKTRVVLEYCTHRNINRNHAYTTDPPQFDCLDCGQCVTLDEVEE